ncbi:hypothetical protein LWF15_33445 [Kineosporia rhizophila]|uniref:hypothetical protein n=1 Tax=Kineosporia rhizophila TaxID=84633 RepID=UPI000A75B3AD|nr:hypothetical protein [Kineosporia rhizophila]MCE0540410.1 hypothetical protein [Kineosporia rhizophila]
MTNASISGLLFAPESRIVAEDGRHQTRHAFHAPVALAGPTAVSRVLNAQTVTAILGQHEGAPWVIYTDAEAGRFGAPLNFAADYLAENIGAPTSVNLRGSVLFLGGTHTRPASIPEPVSAVALQIYPDLDRAVLWAD